jgi:hypothetical protein
MAGALGSFLAFLEDSVQDIGPSTANCSGYASPSWAFYAQILIFTTSQA